MNTDFSNFDKLHQPVGREYDDHYDSRYDSRMDSELPCPLRHPSDSWLAMRKEIIYDTTENWKRSEFRLRLGTIAINYNLGDDISKTTFGIKVAFKDKYGYPQIWRDLPFIQPDLTPYIQQIADAISATLSTSFVTQPQLDAAKAEIDGEINAIAADVRKLSAVMVPAVVQAETRSAVALSAAEIATVSAEAAVEVAMTAKELAEIALVSADALSNVAFEAKDEATAAKEVAEGIAVSATAALDAASNAQTSALTAVEMAAEAKDIATGIADVAAEASSMASSAQVMSFVATYTAGNALTAAEQAIVSAQHLPIVTDRLVQGNYPTYFNCGTATAMN